MRFSKSLDDILKHQSNIKILRFLVNSRAELSGREISRQVGLSHPQCHKTLKELSLQGIVSFRKIGRSLVYKLNDEHYIVTNLLFPLFKQEKLLLRHLAKKLTDALKTPITSVILFGSIAKGTEKPDSDIDLIVITPDKKSYKKARSNLREAEVSTTRKFGNRVSTMLLTASDFRNKYVHGWPLAKDIREEGKVIYGKNLTEVIRIGSQKSSHQTS